LKILLVERGKPPPVSVPDQNSDYGIRTVALNPTTVKFLEQSGAWQHVRRWGVIKQLRVWESTISDTLITFDGAPENDGEIARVVENDEVVRVMKAAVDEANERCGRSVVEFKYGASLDKVCLPHSVASMASVVVDGSPINANLVIGSDGRIHDELEIL
jgi:2-polyprenyl-6-methoxyphenol hydroxylase-like FAD-dependent oxidoreductase